MKARSCFKPFIATILFAMLMLAGGAAFAQPSAQFSANTVSACSPVLVHFTDGSNGNPTYWKWDLGDGTISYLQNPSATYFHPGTYSVKLFVSNSSGHDSLVKTNYIQVFAAPEVNFAASQTSSCNSLSTTFADQTNSASQWQWDFGDGVFSSIQNPSHVYSQAGNYNVSLKAVNARGCSTTLVKASYIHINFAKANFVYSMPALCMPTKISFQNTATANGTLVYKWYFGNGDSSAAANPVYTYATGGIYNVTLKVANEFGCEDIYSRSVAVTNIVSALFSANTTNSCKAPAPIQFTGQHLAGNTYTWSFGDTTFGSSENPLHVYRDTGSYTVRLVVRNTIGCIDSLTKTKYIHIQKPFVSFNNLPDSGCTGFSKRINIINTGTDAVTNYSWNFGDGGISAQAVPTHIFSGERYFTVSLITTGLSGCKDTLVMQNAIYTGAKPMADFTSDVQSSCAQAKVNFVDLSQGRITAWQWNFGDNGQEFEQNPSHRFTDTGFLAAELIILNGGCADTATRYRYVYIKPSVSKFKMDFTCQNSFAYTFTNLSIGAQSWLWDFGDGHTSTERNPVHLYGDTGSYTVALTTYNSITGCDGYKAREVKPTRSTTGFYASDSVLCKGGEVVFTATIDSSEAGRFIWYFGDGTFDQTLGNHVAHRYEQPGSYTVSLVTLNLINCRDSAIKENYISVKRATANFGLVTPVVCAGVPVLFADSSMANAAAGVQSWEWNYGDGHTDTLHAPPFSHIYAAGGNYVVSLTVTDNNGCTDTHTSAATLKVRKPYPVFYTSDTIKCTGSDIRFTAPFSEPNTTYTWDFGDGTFAANQIPRHAYSNEGIYTVKLKVSLLEGCADSFKLVNKIKITDPVAQFAISDSFRNCPPLIVQFTSQSANAIEETWDFGDGTVINAVNPSHFYSYPGIYIAKLTVKGRGGCLRTAQKTIVVKGPKGSLVYGPLQFCQAPANVSFSALTTDATSFIWDFNDGTTVNNSESSIIHQYSASGQFVPKLMLVDNFGCKVPVQGIDSIRAVKLEAKFELPASTVCSGNAALFVNSTTSTDSIISSNWTFGDGFFSSNNGNLLHAFQSPGNYYPSLSVQTLSGCVDTFISATPITVGLSPGISINTSGNNGCTPLTITLNGILNNNDMPVTQWQWDFGNGQTFSGQNPSTQLYTAANNYTIQLSATGNNGCKKTITKNIIAFPLPNVHIAGSTGICKGGNTTLTASGANFYQWFSANGQMSCTVCAAPLVSPQASTAYSVTGVNSFGCSASDSIVVQVASPIQITTNNSVKFCAGSKVQLQVSGADNYDWYPATGLSSVTSSSPYAKPQVDTRYRVIGKDALGCFSDTAFIDVALAPTPTAYAGEDKTIAAGSATELTAIVSSDATGINWSPTGNIFRNDGVSITVKPIVTTEYMVVAKNAAGCTATDKVKVIVSNEDVANTLFIPNTFSPNGDGANDIFYARSSGSIKIIRFKIMNRDGAVVFERNNFYSNDVSSGWDGNYRGSKAAIDVYMYGVEIAGSDGKQKIISGNVSMVR